jgi:hypothetical protein
MVVVVVTMVMTGVVVVVGRRRMVESGGGRVTLRVVVLWDLNMARPRISETLREKESIKRTALCAKKQNKV